MARKLFLICLAALLFSATVALSASTKVGNGDEGKDLEGAELVTSGKLINTRDQALTLLRKLNVKGIAGLGKLESEILYSKIYLTQGNVKHQNKNISFEINKSGQVYARTFPEHYAATRFFPVALELSDQQLIALHIHEGLHRSLPSDIKTNEDIVTEITLSITSPDATFDQVSASMNQFQEDKIQTSQASVTTSVEEHFKKPSSLSYELRLFNGSHLFSGETLSVIQSIKSEFYPFGSVNHPFGMGIEMSLVKKSGQTLMGPLGLSLRYKAWTIREFEILLAANAALNMLSADELKQSPFGRDVITFGIEAKKTSGFVYLDNFIGLTLPSQTTQTIGSIDYHHQFKETFQANIHGGITFLDHLKLGAFVELYLASGMKVSGGAFQGFDTGRYRIVTWGPEVSWRTSDFFVNTKLKMLLNSTPGVNLDYLGDVLNTGVAEGSFSASAGLYF